MITDVIFKNPNILELAPAIKTAKEVITYQELKKNIQTVAGYLLAGGCRAGDAVLIWLNNSPEFVISYFAVILLGGTAVLADTKFRQEIYEIIKENQVKLIITDSDKSEHMTDKSEVVVITAEEIHKIVDYNGYIEVYKKYDKAKATDENQIATVLYTSGSAGRPKAVINSHKNLCEALKNYTETVSFTSADKFLGVVPFFHSYAFDSSMLAAFNAGAMLYLMGNFVPVRVLRVIEEEKITVFHGVPFMYQLMNGQLRAGNYNVGSLRYCICAGSRLEKECLTDFYHHTGKVIHQEYGSTETGTIAINLSMDLEKASKYAGQPLKHVELKLVSFEGAKEALLQVISKGMAIGYLGETPFFWTGYQTQDLCVIEEGYLKLLGRADRLINITGLKVNPIEVENCLKSHPDIADAFVKGVDSEEFGEAVKAYIVKRKETLTIKEVTVYCKENLAAYKVPGVITWVEEIEKSGLGKTKYK